MQRDQDSVMEKSELTSNDDRNYVTRETSDGNGPRILTNKSRKIVLHNRKMIKVHKYAHT